MSISSIAYNITYDKLIQFNEEKIIEILKFQQSSQKNKKIANDCAANLEKNILKNYSLLITIDKVTPFKDNAIFKSEELEQIFMIFKKDYIEQVKSKDDIQSNKIRFEFLEFFIRILGELKQYNILKKILMEKIFLNEEKKKEYINQFINEFKGKNLFNKEEIKFYEFLIVEFNHLEQNLDYKIKNIENGNFNFEIKLKTKVENMKCLEEFIYSFLKQKDKDVIEEMKIFLLEFYAENYNFLLKKYNKFFEELSQTSYDINLNIDFLKKIINNSEKNYIVKAKSLSSLSKKAIFKVITKIDNKEKDFSFYGNKTINEINKYLNNYIKEFKNKDENKDIEDFKIKLKCDKNEISLNELNSNKTLNELYNGCVEKNSPNPNKKKFEITIEKDRFTIDKCFKDDKLTERFNEIVKNWFYKFSEGKEKLNETNIANFINELIGRKENQFTEKSIKVYHFIKTNSSKENELEEMTLEKIQNFFIKKCKKEPELVLTNIQNMNLTPDLIEKPLEIDNSKLPRYYLSNEIEEYAELYLINPDFLKKSEYSNSEEMFDFISSLSVNESIYNEILNNFNKNQIKFNHQKAQYLYNMYILYIIENIIEDVEISNNKENIIDNEENQNKKEGSLDEKKKS